MECFQWAQNFAVLHLISYLIKESDEAGILWILISQMKESKSREVGQFVRHLIPRRAQDPAGFTPTSSVRVELAVLRLLSARLYLQQVNVGWLNEKMSMLTLSSRHLKVMLVNKCALYVCMPPQHVFLPFLRYAASWIAMWVVSIITCPVLRVWICQFFFTLIWWHQILLFHL